MSIFDLSAVSTNKRSSSVDPKFIVNAGTEKSKGGIKLNEATSRLLNIEAGDYVTFVSDYKAVQAAIAQKHEAITAWAEENGEDPKNYPVEWYLAKGWELQNSDGTPKLVPERLTDAMRADYEERGEDFVDEDGKAKAQMVQAYKGSKVNSQNGAAGFGILHGSDSTNWAPLGGNLDTNVEYDVELSPKTEMVGGVEREVFMLVNPTAKDKIVRG